MKCLKKTKAHKPRQFDWKSNGYFGGGAAGAAVAAGSPAAGAAGALPPAAASLAFRAFRAFMTFRLRFNSSHLALNSNSCRLNVVAMHMQRKMMNSRPENGGN